MSGRKTIHHLHGRLRGKPGPYLLPLSGVSTLRLLTGASAATAVARTPSGHVRPREKPKHPPPSSLSSWSHHYALGRLTACFTRSQQRPLPVVIVPTPKGTCLMGKGCYWGFFSVLLVVVVSLLFVCVVFIHIFIYIYSSKELLLLSFIFA